MHRVVPEVSCELLLISGSLRARSTNTAALRTIEAAAPSIVHASLYDELADLPAFNPDLDTDEPPPEVRRLRTRIHSADALVFSTPEYAGALPGSLKNLLDWTIGDDQAGSIYQKPVVWLNTSPRGAAGAHAELRMVLEYAHASIVEEACADVPVTQAMLGPEGLVTDPATLDRIDVMLELLAARVVASSDPEPDPEAGRS